jgi:hypothetical protein
MDGRYDVPTSTSLPTTTAIRHRHPLLEGHQRRRALLEIDRRALANVVFLHETVHAMSHLARDVDGRRWEGVRPHRPETPAFRPSALHETFAQFFTHRLLTRLGDSALLTAFEQLSKHQPSEYNIWRKMVDVPTERVRQLLIRARTGLDDTPWG